MQFPPEPMLYASLQVLYVAAYTTRNWTTSLQQDVPQEQINDLWEALHEIPRLLTCWGTSYPEKDYEKEVLRYLREYKMKWDTPDLEDRFVQAYKEALGRQIEKNMESS